jgi:type I restriction enzyme S subunit
MGSDWKEHPLEDCMAAIIDYRGKTPTKTPSGVPLITAKVVKGGRIEKPDEFIAEEDYDAWMRRGMPEPGDVVITTEAPLGEVAQLGNERVALAQRLIALRGKQGVLDNTFLKFLMQSRGVQDQLLARASGTTVFGIRQSELRKVILTLPPFTEQRAIANVLGTLDDKIDLNTRMNETLEGMAHALFKSWFVDFDPVRAKAEGEDTSLSKSIAELFPDSFEDSEIGEIPTGWHVGRIEDIAEINAFTLSRTDPLDVIDYLEISEVMRGDIGNIVSYKRGGEPSRARRRLRHGDTVLSTVRPDRGSYFLALNPAETLVVSTGFAVLTPKNGVWAFLYSLATQREVGEHLGRLADGGAYPAIRAEVIGKLRVPLPPTLETVLRFEQLVKPLYEKSAQNRMQSRILGQLRDALLPKLISGELPLPDAERIVGGRV